MTPPNNPQATPFLSDPRPQRFAWAPGNYSCKCWTCDKDFIGHKRAHLCAPCAYNDAGIQVAVARELAASAREVERLKAEMEPRYFNRCLEETVAFGRDLEKHGYEMMAKKDADDLRAENAKLRAELATAREALEYVLAEDEQTDGLTSIAKKVVIAALNPQPGAKA